MYPMITVWLRAIRIRFLFASIIAVINGLAISFWKNGSFDINYAVLTCGGVICLHASVDLLNDYWDYRSGIDKVTKRTKFSGGTGVLPENLLKPKTVYCAGILFLVLGSLIGTYFVVIRGITIAIILVFAIIAIYFYSTKIVNLGLGELFVAVKSSMIVVGTFYVQVGFIDMAAIYIGVIIGTLSASVLFVNSFPDYCADRDNGRRTLVIILGKKRGAKVLSVFVSITYLMIAVGVLFGYTRLYSLISFVSIPLAARAIRYLNENNEKFEKLVPAMTNTLLYSRITGILLAIGLLL
jgi:1,4-dihydroxy-2-naphthoate polyprenyltransferase